MTVLLILVGIAILLIADERSKSRNPKSFQPKLSKELLGSKPKIIPRALRSRDDSKMDRTPWLDEVEVVEASAYEALELKMDQCIGMLRAELKAAREEIEKEKKCHSLAKLACEQLIKERTLYRTVDALLGDNGRICELHDDIEALGAEYDAYKAQCEKLLEYLKDVIRNSSDILAKKHCSNGLAEHETWLKERD